MADAVFLQQLGIALQDVAVALEDLDRLRMAALRAQRRPMNCRARARLSENSAAPASR